MKVALFDTAWTQRSLDALWAVCSPGVGDGGEAEGVVVGLHTRADRAWIDLWPNLRFIATCTTGLDHIDTDYARQRGIEIISLQGDPFLRDVWATAEHTMALILALARRIPWAYASVQNGNWKREDFQGIELRGKTLGIVGYGRVGRQVGEMAKAFGMALVLYDPPCTADLSDVLRESDIVTVHVPLTDDTRFMFDHAQFHAMKSSALFVNTSRGAVVRTGALLGALQLKRIAGAALDVLYDEPGISEDVKTALRQGALSVRDNLILTPHIGGNTRESREKTQLHIAAKIARFVEERGRVGSVVADREP